MNLTTWLRLSLRCRSGRSASSCRLSLDVRCWYRVLFYW